ncbi:hypothetical protein ABEB36_006110 [Hypothenemus hampei]|uniref:Uncharacterized protein n=1 Tax=Hypothenemus hampei TaxID=57062 RepID=A0ABD1F0I1_HYPHA
MVMSLISNCDDGELIKVYQLVPQAMNIIGLNKRDDHTKRRNAAKNYICAVLEHLNLFYLYLNCNLHWLQKFSGLNIENENRNESSAFYMIFSHDETQPEPRPTSAEICPSLPSSPPPSSTLSIEGSVDGPVSRLVDGPVAGSVDGIVKGRIKKRKRTTRAEQFLKDAISHYSDLRENWCKSRLQPNTKKGTFPIGVSVEKFTIPSENEVYRFPGLRLNRIPIFFYMREHNSTTSMSLRCEILTTRAIQGKRLL